MTNKKGFWENFTHLLNITFVVVFIIFFWLFIINLFMKGLGLDMDFIKNIVVIFSGAFIVILVSRNFIKIKKIRKYLDNNYLVASILLIFAFTLLGFNIITDAYKINNQFNTELPHSQPVETKQSSWITCNTEYDTYVESYDIKCVSYLNHHNKSFKPTGVLILEGNKSDYLDFDTDETGNIKFDIPVKEGKNKYHLMYNFNKNRSVETFYRGDITFRAISEENYFNRVHQKILLIFAVFSFSIFSIIAGMKYLKDIIEEKKK